jgi:hypothetical protein
MESKDDSLVSSVADVDSARSKNVVVKFCEYAYKVLNDDMDEFFEDHIADFDQNEEELESGRGETLEQFSVYQKYVSELEKYFDDFSAQEGYSNAKECFKDISELISKDQEEREKSMKEITERLRAVQEQWLKKFAIADESASEAAGAKDEAKTVHHSDEKHASSEEKGAKGDDSTSLARRADSKADGKAEADEEAEPAVPIMLFFQPVSMETMLTQVLTLTEYSTFSDIMRAKVRQKKLLELMERKVSLQSVATAERHRILGGFLPHKGSSLIEHQHYSGNAHPVVDKVDAHVDLTVLVEQYQALIDRICDLTPNEKSLIEGTCVLLDMLGWRAVVGVTSNASDRERSSKDVQEKPTRSGNLTIAEKKEIFSKLVMNSGLCLWRLCSIEQQFAIRSELNVMLPKIASINNDDSHATDTIHRLQALFLNMSHDMVDQIERGLYAILREYEQQHKAKHQNRKRK